MDWLVSEGILRPHGETTLESLIYQARNQAEECSLNNLLDN